MKRKLSLLAAFACICGGGGHNAQAQLFIDIFPSQDSTNQTLWIFSGSSRSGVTVNNVGPHIRSSGSYDRRDTHKTTRAFVRNTAPALYNLTPVVTSTATNAPLDLESLRTRLGATIKLGTTNTLDDITIPSTATNVPTLRFAVANGTNTIASMFLNDVNNTGWDDIGPRTSSQLNYGLSQPNVNWIGAAIMTNKPIGHFHLSDFFATRPQDRYTGNRPGNGVLRSWTAHQENQGLRIRVHGAVIPEPEEYALVFGLFALGFVFFHRHITQKKRQAATL